MNPSPNRDNPIFRFKAALWALAMLLLFAVLAWIFRIGFPPPPPTLEELAAANRDAIRAEVDAAETGKAPSAETLDRVAKELLTTKPTPASPAAPASPAGQTSQTGQTGPTSPTPPPAAKDGAAPDSAPGADKNPQ